MRIVLADDHRLVRDGIKFYLSRLASSAQILEAGTFEEALEKATSEDPPDLIILDLNMPGMRGFEGLDIVRDRLPGVPVAILSGSISPEDVIEALDHGAAGYLPKTLSGKAMINALKLILSGERYVPSIALPSSALRSGRRAGGGPPARDRDAGAPMDKLTEREREVLALLVKGKSNKEIARELALQDVTVRLHLKGVFRKLGVSNRTQAAILAVQHGFRQK